MNDLRLEKDIWADIENDDIEKKELIFEPKSFANEYGPLLISNYLID